MAETPVKLTRAEKNEKTRASLLAAAAEIVGEKGYRDASVTDITARADIGLGTFYNYFESKQDILDQLLPEMGERLLEFLGNKAGESTFLEREEKSLRAYFQFIREHPEFYRVLVEAQVYSPDSFSRHVSNLIRNYKNSLRKTKEKGFLADYAVEEFEAIASILLGARVYLMGQFCFRKGSVRRVPEHVIHTFMKVMAFGLNGTGGTTTRRRQEARKRAKASGEGTVLPEPEILHACGEELMVRYVTPEQQRGLRCAEAYAFVQQVCTKQMHDLLVLALGTDTAVQLKSASFHLMSSEMSDQITVAGRIEKVSAHEGMLYVRITGADTMEAAGLATAQAAYCCE